MGAQRARLVGEVALSQPLKMKRRGEPRRRGQPGPLCPKAPENAPKRRGRARRRTCPGGRTMDDSGRTGRLPTCAQ